MARVGLLKYSTHLASSEVVDRRSALGRSPTLTVVERLSTGGILPLGTSRVGAWSGRSSNWVVTRMSSFITERTLTPSGVRRTTRAGWPRHPADLRLTDLPSGREERAMRGAHQSLCLVLWILPVLTLLAACTPAAPANSMPSAKSTQPAVGAPTVQTDRAAPADSLAPANEKSLGRTPTTGGALTVGLNSQIAALDPNKLSSAIDESLSYQLYDRLVAVSSRGARIDPWLASAWTMSPDGRAYVFKLRSDVKFHDGGSFDANSAKKNFERLSASAADARIREIARRLKTVSAPDDTTLRVELDSPFPAFLTALEAVPMLSPAAWERWGDDFGQHPVGTGPFKLKEWVPQDHFTLERNPDYAWPPATSTNPGPAYLDSVTFKLIQDPPARLVSLESGDTQMITYTPLQDVARIASEAGFKIVRGSSPGMPLTFFVNLNYGLLADRQVRVAIQSALDRSDIIQAGGYGVPIPAAGLLSSTTRCFSDSFGAAFPFDPSRARQLLDEAGWLVGPDGIREKDSERLTFDLVHFPDYANVAAVVQGQLREIGIQVDLKMLDLAAAVALMRAGQAPSFLVGGIYTDASVLSSWFHSRAIGTSSASGAVLKDAQIDALLDHAAQEPDPDKQCMLYQQFEQRYLDAAVAYPVWEVVAVLAMRSNVEGVRLVPAAPNLPLFQEVYLDR